MPPDLVQSVDRALSLLDALAERGGFVSLQALSEDAGLNASTAHRLLQTLQWHDLIRRDPATREYALGLGLLRLAAALRSQLDLRQEARPILESLAQETGESANLVVLDGHWVVYVDQAASAQPVRAFTQVGARAPLHCTGVGKALLAFMPEVEREAVLDGNLRAYTSTTITNPLRLSEQLARIRERSVALDMGERQEDVRCIASPVFDDRSRAVAAISISGPRHRLHRERIEELSPLVRRAGRDLSAALGWPGPKGTGVLELRGSDVKEMG
jgi:DNA-binding IclR family transcriptional regulator